MSLSQWIRWSLASWCLLALTISGVADAYILPARFYLRKAASQRTRFRNLKVSQTTTYVQGNRAQKVDERVFLQIPGKLRVERRVDKKLVQVDICSGTTWIQWKDGKTTRRTRRIRPRYDLFVVEPSGSGFGNIFRLMRKLRVRYKGARRYNRDTDYREQVRVGLAWFRAGPVVVLGSRRVKSKRNQVWLDKRRYVPRRIRSRLSKKGPRWDVRFLEYHKIGGQEAYPGRVEVYRDGRLAVRSLTYRVQKVSSLPARLFQQVR